MEIAWATFGDIGYGEYFGYSAANIQLSAAISSMGVKICDEADIVVHLTHAANFKPRPGCRNVLFTMYEGKPVPSCFPEAFKSADVIVTPSRYCVDLLQEYSDILIQVCPLGFDSSLIKRRERVREKGAPFVWLWVGALNSRKGWDSVVGVWDALFADIPWMHLVMKTSSVSNAGVVETKGNITFDSRRYSNQEMANLYGLSHAFVLPTAGEGWGLTLLEAQASGLPVVTTRVGGQMDFLREKETFFVDHDMADVITRDGSPFKAAVPKRQNLGRVMIRVMDNYPVAVSKAMRGASRVRNEFTWDRSARRFMDILGMVDVG